MKWDENAQAKNLYQYTFSILEKFYLINSNSYDLTETTKPIGDSIKSTILVEYPISLSLANSPSFRSLHCCY